MRRGWDVLLSGERSSSGRMQLDDGLEVRGRVWQPVGLGVQVVCEVVGEGPLGAEDVFETAFEERRAA